MEANYMTPESQRIAIAESCGWKRPPPHPSLKDDPNYVWSDQGSILPDYLNDLNAMHEAEKVLNRFEQRDGYWQHLSVITERGRTAPIYYLLATATASQRAEAFLKTLGLWI